MDTNGPSGSQLYSNAGKENTPPDTGLAMGNNLYNAELAARTRYAEPMMGTNPRLGAGMDRIGGGEVTDPPSYYNYAAPPPVKYSVPSQAKERMVARQALRQAVATAPNASQNVPRPDPITDEEVNYLQSMRDQAELADFDRYVNSLIDVRKPGNLKWLMEIYPDFVNRRIKQVHTDYEYALRGQMIDTWGINTFDDLHFKYLQDQGKIAGPVLTNLARPGLGYESGWLAPAAFKSERLRGVRLPFASARFGKHARDGASWTMSDAGQPLSHGRELDEMARSMYQNNLEGAANLTGDMQQGVHAAEARQLYG